MPQFQPSVWIFVVFALLALAALAGIGFFIADRLQPVIMNALRSNDRLLSLQSRRRGARRRQEDDEPADDLDDSTQLVLSMLSLASVVVDDQDEVVRANPAAYRLGLVRDDTLIEPTLLDAVHKVMKDGSRCSFDLETQTPEQFMTMNGFGAAAADDGLTAEASSRPNWLKVTVGRIGDHLVLVLINDVSESIRFAQIRDSFISNVSEQLLQPTRALERLADSLESADVSYEQLANHARQVRHSCVRLDRMISDLLMLIKAQEPVTASEANRCDLFSQVSGAVDDLAGAARDAGVQVRVGGKSPVMIHGEADQIRMAVRKMVENAIVYSHPGGAVGVSVALSSDGKNAVVRVIDHGEGVPKADLPRIFERFYRGSNQNERTTDGIGLGLAIVKHAALAHHGDVTVWSAPGQGSTFTLSLPVGD